MSDKPNGPVQFWEQHFESSHGYPYPAEWKRDAAILHGLVKKFGKFAVGWMIQEFLSGFKEDVYVSDRGWDIPCFRAKAQGLYHRWQKEVRQPQVRQEREAHERANQEMLNDPKVIDLTDRIGLRVVDG